MVNLPWKPDLPIRTDRLELRPHQSADLDDLLVYHSDPEVVRYIPWPVRDRVQTAAALESRTRQGRVTAEGQWLVLAIELGASEEQAGRVIGEVLLKLDSTTDARGELGYAMAADVAGRGYATEASRAVLRLGFEEFGLHRIVARLDARNDASARLLRRLGLRQEAHFVRDDFFKGEWTDTLVFAMLAEEWERRENGEVRADIFRRRFGAPN
jgi:RimJ/RimL family protein N-acetyltransferase